MELDSMASPSHASSVASYGENERQLQSLKTELHERLVRSLNLSAVRTLEPERLKEELRRGAEELCVLHGGLLSQSDRERLVDDVVHEALGLGPLEPLMRDPTVSDILINGPDSIYVERKGKLEETTVHFRD